MEAMAKVVKSRCDHFLSLLAVGCGGGEDRVVPALRLCLLP